MYTLTELEKDVLLNGIVNSGFYDFEKAYIWSDSLVDTCKLTTKAQIGGVVASLVKKGLIKEAGERDLSEASVRLTSKGLEALEQIECSIVTPKNPQDIVRMNAIGSCLSAIHDIRFVEMSDDAKDAILRDVHKQLGAIYDSLKQSLEG